MNEEPLFCFKTAVKMLYYWANLVYNIDNEDQEVSKNFALDLYRLDHFDFVSSRDLLLGIFFYGKRDIRVEDFSF